jgi:hypothetical protein
MEEYNRILTKKEMRMASSENLNQSLLSVFISYSVADREKVESVVNNLRAIQGVRIFFADFSIGPGDIINQKIINAIIQCNIFLVFYSRNSINSVYVQQEIGAALATGKIPIPILLDDIKPSGMIANNIHYLDFSDENKKYLEYSKLHQFLVNLIQQKVTERNKNILGALLFLGIGYLALKSEEDNRYNY